MRRIPAAVSRSRAYCSARVRAGQEPPGGGKHIAAVHRVAGVLHRAMAFLEDKFHALLDDPHAHEQREPDRCVLPAVMAVLSEGKKEQAAPPYPAEIVERQNARR